MEELASVKGLRRLSMRGCGLEGGEFLLPLKALLELELADNPHLLSLDSFPRLEVLEMLSAPRCGILSLEMVSARFPSLVILDLAANSLRSLIEVDELGGLRELAELRLAGNPLAREPEEYRERVVEVCGGLEALDGVTLCAPGSKIKEETERIRLALQEERRPLVTVDDILNEVTRLAVSPKRKPPAGREFAEPETELVRLTQEIEQFQRKMKQMTPEEGPALLERVKEGYDEVRRQAHAASDRVRLAEAQNLRKLAEERGRSRQSERRPSPERPKEKTKYQAKIGVNPFPRMKRGASVTKKTPFQKSVEQQLEGFLAQTADFEQKNSAARLRIEQARQFVQLK